MIDKKTVERFKAIVGKDNVLESEADRICYSYDATKQSFLPEIVLRPTGRLS